MATKISVAVDATSGISNLNALISSLKATSDRIEDVNVTAARFNKNGNLLSATVESQTGAFGKVVQTLRNVKGALTVVSSQYTENAKAARAAADAIVEATARAAEKRAKIRDKSDAADAKARDKAYADAEKARLKAIDKEISDAGKLAKKKEDDSRKEADRLAKQGSLLDNALQRVGRNLVQFASYRAFNFVVDGLESGVRAAKDFQIQLSLIRTISQDGQQSFSKFGQNVRGVSDRSGIDIKDVGKAFYDTTSNQIAKGSDVAPFVKQATDFARVTGSELPDAVNLLSSAINSYGLSAADAERISAVLFKTIDEGRIVASELANTFGRVGVLANGLGISLEDVSATLAITTQKGFKTADAMTLLTNLMIKLEKPTEATQSFFKNIIGVDSAEAAITLLGGLPQLMRRIVQEVRAGNVDVSAFFDEIRGRKQFAIFEQSIDQIEKFSDSLKGTSKVVADYKKAIEIRGESPADKLVIEANKLANVFKVDLGQAILKVGADLIAFTGGVENIAKITPIATDALKIGTTVLVAYGITIVANTAYNAGFAGSFYAVRNAALAASAALGPYILAAVAAGAAYKAVIAVTSGRENVFGKVDPKDMELTAAALERYKKSAREIQEIGDPFASFAKSQKDLNETYKSAIGLIAGANKANNKFLDEASAKAPEVADKLKLAFAGYTEGIQKNIAKIKQGVTAASAEIERSLKSALKFNESLDEKLFNQRLKYANEDFGNQKQGVIENRQVALQAKADKLYKEGTEESIAEARKLYDTLAENEVQLDDLRMAKRQKLLENSGQTGTVFNVYDETPLSGKLGDLAKRRAESEKVITDQRQQQVNQGNALEQSENRRLDRFQQAIKNYEKLEVLTKDGKVKEEYTTGGKFDINKFTEASIKAEQALRDNVGKEKKDREALEQVLFEKRINNARIAQGIEQREALKVAEAKINADKDSGTGRIEALKQERIKLEKERDTLGTSLSRKEAELRGFANLVGEAGTPFVAGVKDRIPDKPFDVQGWKDFFGEKPSDAVAPKGLLKADEAKINAAIEAYKRSVDRLNQNPVMRDGVASYDKARLKEVGEWYDEAVRTITEVRNKYNKAGDLKLKVGETEITPGGAKAAIRQEIEEGRSNSDKLYENKKREEEESKKFKTNVTEPLEKLTKQFPELAETGKKATESLNGSFRSLNDGGVKDLEERLKRIQGLMPKALPNGKVGLGEVGDTGVAYAASGGIVGMFPGQPRGVDQYPIWAARGERIIPADISAMYAPVLDAVMQRRNPQYMAEGGMVGGDTIVGDININVQGAATNTDTARVIGNQLERQLRLNNVNLNRRKR